MGGGGVKWFLFMVERKRESTGEVGGGWTQGEGDRGSEVASVPTTVCQTRG